MRYEDASATGSFTADQALVTPSSLNANSDVDVILAGQYGPATGNAITGTGTISGIAGADMVGAGASITAIQGAGGTDASFSGGKLQVAGEHGVLTIDAQGNYSYVRNQGSPNGVSDVFTYTLAGRDGDTDLATLTINIGKTPLAVQANAVQVVPGPDGVVTLPDGVELSDIHVVGRNLVVELPDGSQMVIVDGAVFVPQLVLGTVEVPSTNLAALLIDSEPTPAAGPPQSSGGNFAVPVAPLDPGAPLGDLIPPTELSYTPPEFQELAQAVEEDEPVLILDLTPSISGGDAIVDEDDLLASRGANESAGSDTAKESLTVAGTFTLVAPDGVQSLTVGSLNVIVNGAFQAGATLTTPLGNTLTITGYNAATGVVSYTYTLNDNEAHASGAGENSLFEDFLVTLTDEDGDVDTDTLSVNIVDDVPVANDDAAGLLFGGPISVTVDVDTNDVPGADGTASRVFASLNGTYGNLTLNADGTQTYTLSASGIAVMNNLPTGQTLTDTFTYTLTDGDGDTDPANLVVTLTGGDDPVLITNLTPSAQGGDAIVDEDDLPDGSDTVKESLTVTGDFTISAPDGVNDLTVGGINVIVDGVFQVGATGATPLGNTITFTGYNAATGVVSYSYTLLDNETHANANGQNSLFDDMAVVLTDVDNDVANGTLSVQIVDDVPTANDDAFTIFEGDADNAITFDVDLNDVPGADGTATREFTSLTGVYGNLVVNPDGTQTYTLTAFGIATLNGLSNGATLNDNFTYTLTDGDGDSDPATLVITLQGTDDPVLITNLTPSVNGGDAIVDEDDLGDGSDTSPESLTVNGDFTISAPDGVDDLTVGGVQVIVNGVFQVGATGATPLGNTITFTGYDAATGVVSYSYTLLDNEAHANANGENSLFDDMLVALTDVDGDTDTDTLSVQIVDDVPTANDDAASQGAENSPVVVNVIANDVQGADGVDVDNNPAVRVELVAGTLSGAGGLVYNDNGTFTYTPAAGEEGIVTFDYRIIDGDGDPSVATVTITLDADSVPIVTAAVAAVDDDGLTGGNPASVTGDLDANVGEVPLSASEATYNGTFVANFGGDTGTFSLAAMHGTSGTVGTELVNYTYAGNVLTATGPRGVLFTVTVTPATGAYTVQLVDNVLHDAGGDENDATAALTFTASDSDGDSTNGTLTITFDDDMPSNFSPVDLIDQTNATATTQDDALVNDGTANVTRLINDANNDGVGENFMGADGFGSLTFSGGTNGAQLQSDGGTPLTSGGLAIFVFGYGTDTLTATTDATNTNPAAVVFTATLTPGAGSGSASTYTIDFNQAIDDGSGFVFDDFSTAPAGQNDWIGLDADLNDINVDNNDSEDLLITPTNVGGSVNTSATDIGNSNQWIDQGEGIRIDYVTDVRRDGANDEKDVQGYTFDGHYNVTESSFTVMQTAGGGTSAVRIQAFLDPDTGGIKNLTGATVPIDASSIVVTNGGVAATGYTVFDMGDGTFVITGLEAGDNVAFDTNGADFNAVSITSADGMLNTTTPAPADTFAGADFAVGEFGFLSETQGNPLDITLGVTATDADGDAATGTIDITLVPAPLNAAPLTASNDDQQQTQKVAANSNTVVLAAAVAAAGLAAEAAAANDDNVGEESSALSPESQPVAIDESASSGSEETERSELGGETSEALVEESSEASGSASSSEEQAADGHSLTADNDLSADEQPAALLEGTEAPAGVNVESIVSPVVSMPSAEALIAASKGGDVEGGQSNAVVGQVLVDALEGGGAEGSVDALLEALPAQGLGENAALEALASRPDAAVSAWDMGHSGGLPANANFTMEAMALHHDAVQPVANG